MFSNADSWITSLHLTPCRLKQGAELVKMYFGPHNLIELCLLSFLLAFFLFVQFLLFPLYLQRLLLSCSYHTPFGLYPGFSLEPSKYLPRVEGWAGLWSSSHWCSSVTHLGHLSSTSFDICGWMILAVLKGCALFPWTFSMQYFSLFPWCLLQRGGMHLIVSGCFMGREGDKTSSTHTVFQHALSFKEVRVLFKT